jgi:N-acetylglucosaminyldiphosphoundecaprenol N-acetyl-beta-D-mannosaminyltransferase
MGLVARPPAVEPFPPERILGQPVHPVSKAQAVRAIIELATGEDHGAYVCLTNAHTTVEAQASRQLRAAVETAFLSVPDGMPLTWILRGRGHRHTETVTGIELVPMVASAGLESGLRHFFYGGAPGIASRAGRRLQELVPGTHVVGAATPPFTTVDAFPIEDLQRELESTKPHILWVGLGAPKQELWMAAMAGALDVPVMVGVGAAFDYLAGTKPPAPAYLRHVGLEWAFRLATEPRRLWRRYLVTNSRFVWLLARERLMRTTGRSGQQGDHRPKDGEGFA